MCKQKKLSLSFALTVLLFSLSALLVFISKNESAALFIGRVSFCVRIALALLTNIFPYSLFEGILLFSPLLISFAVIYPLWGAKQVFKKRVLRVLSIFLFVSSLYILTFLIPNNITDSKIEEDNRNDLGSEDLNKAASILINNISNLCGSEEMDSAYGIYDRIFYEVTLKKGYNLINVYPRIKTAFFSGILSKMNILALYSPFTGEIILNSKIPQYIAVFTVAHEYAHYLGAESEADASFLAFLSLYSSDNDYLSYSASLVALEYIMSDLYLLDSGLYSEIYEKIPTYASLDIKQYYEFYKNNQGIVSDISDKANSAHTDIIHGDGHGGYSDVSYIIAEYLLRQM